VSRALGTQLLQQLKISGTPSLGELAHAFQHGYRRIVNVSGTSLKDIYSPEELACWDLSEHRMRDLFTDANELEPNQRGATFATLATPEERTAYLSACTAVQEGLVKLESTLVLCKLGVGRSPAVVFGALRAGFGLSAAAARDIVNQLRPQAVISNVTESAADWLLARSSPAVA
jgi:hypothetical protein